MSLDCTSCKSIGSLEYVPEASALACTKCGAVSESSSSHMFEMLGRVDGEDAYQNGRTYIGGSYDALGGLGGAGARGMGGRAAAWASKAGEYKAVYHTKRAVRSTFSLQLRR